MPEAFNKAKLLGKIKRKLGLFYIKLPVSDDDLLGVIDEDTIPTYSIYFPQEIRVKISNEDKVPGTTNTYFIDERHIGSDINIVDIIAISNMCNPLHSSAFRPMSVQDVASLQMQLDHSSILYDPVVYKYIPPNKIEVSGVYNSSLGTFYVDVLATHNKRLTSIRPTQIDSFTKLALLDSKEFLYQNLKHFDQIETTFGQINLKIEEWSNASSEKEELLSQWNEKYLANRSRNIFVF